MRKLLKYYAGTTLGFAAAMLLHGIGEPNAELRKAKLRAVPLSIVWPVYLPIALKALNDDDTQPESPEVIDHKVKRDEEFLELTEKVIARAEEVQRDPRRARPRLK